MTAVELFALKDGEYKQAGIYHHSLIAATLVRQFGTSNGAPIDKPMPTVMPEGGGKTHLVAAFLSQFNGSAVGQCQDKPCNTVTSRDRFALIKVQGTDFLMNDILFRMLQPSELYLAQGFPSDYIIAPEYKGKPLTKTAQVRMCGNSVSPPVAEALVRANFVSQQVAVRA